MAISGEIYEKRDFSLFVVVVWFILIIASTSFLWKNTLYGVINRVKARFIPLNIIHD